MNISDKIELFRRRSRAAWDICFGGRNVAFNDLDIFFRFRRDLFWALVMDESATIQPSGVSPDSSLGLAAGQLRAYGVGGTLRLLLNAEKQRFHGLWKPEIAISSDSVHAAVLDLFDWDPLRSLEHEFFLVKITESGERPDLVGFYGLVRASNCVVTAGDNEGDERRA